MLQECESNRCLITVLIAGRGETRAFSQWRATAEMITPPHSSHSRAPFSRHFMAELPGMNNSNVSTPRARVYLETRAHTTATNSQISHLTPVQDLLESWSCKLWKGVFFLLPPTFFFLGGGDQLKLLSYFTTTLEEITESEWAAQIIDSMLKPSLGALSSRPGSCLQYTQGSSELITLSLSFSLSFYAAVTISHSWAAHLVFYLCLHTRNCTNNLPHLNESQWGM